MRAITIITPMDEMMKGKSSFRMRENLDKALEKLPDIEANFVTEISEEVIRESQKFIFAIALPKEGVNAAFYEMIAGLRLKKYAVKDSHAGIVVDCDNHFYGKQLARELAFTLNESGVWLPGESLVEATGDLSTFRLRAKLNGMSEEETYVDRLRDLIDRVAAFKNHKADVAKLTVIETSDSSVEKTSNSSMLWKLVKQRLNQKQEESGHKLNIQEISLKNGDIFDCRGCPYEMCLNYAKEKSCYYGGQIVSEVYPSILDADALLFVSPNYNDAPNANITALINRLTALIKTNDLRHKKLFAIIVSGYSGGDIVAQQFIGAMNMNKSFSLPPGFALIEIANDAGEILKVDNIGEKANGFADNLIDALFV